MSTKKVSFKKHSKEPVAPAAFNQEAWVSTGQQPAEAATIRFTIDLPLDLHTRMKTQCAARRVKMKEVIQGLLEQAFPQESSN